MEKKMVASEQPKVPVFNDGLGATVRMLPGATKHLRSKGYWLDDYDTFLNGTLDGRIGTITSRYLYVEPYPHVGVSVDGCPSEVGIAAEWLQRA